MLRGRSFFLRIPVSSGPSAGVTAKSFLLPKSAILGRDGILGFFIHSQTNRLQIVCDSHARSFKLMWLHCRLPLQREFPAKPGGQRGVIPCGIFIATAGTRVAAARPVCVCPAARPGRTRPATARRRGCRHTGGDGTRGAAASARRPAGRLGVPASRPPSC